VRPWTVPQRAASNMRGGYWRHLRVLWTPTGSGQTCSSTRSGGKPWRSPAIGGSRLLRREQDGGGSRNRRSRDPAAGRFGYRHETRVPGGESVS